ncbi:homoserine dehydrogenase [Cordyceps javanica]|uniref:homoserine dehydrogenase n=1 Tax=Cordyceps javanica TaxID=43265 RepID=A0A545VIB1_9HYPO|nr:homoserine dehydrogenase [Cordyceps javanica]TQW01469.1 homoserine dehydrogenase [Cordyceps javanica]
MAAANRVFIAVLGAGGVGKSFLRQLQAHATRRPSPKLTLCYISTSKKAVFHVDYFRISINTALDALGTSTTTPLELPQVIEYLAAAPGKTVLVDNTSSQDVANKYPVALSRGISINDIFIATTVSGAKVYHKSSVSAGLPLVSTLKDLIDTGDKSLIPEELKTCTNGDDFLEKLSGFNTQIEETKAAAEQAGKVIRFVGIINVPANAVKVRLQEFDRSHPIAATKGSDNIIIFHTKRYGSNPLIMQGAGAGGDATAMGVTADRIKLISPQECVRCRRKG